MACLNTLVSLEAVSFRREYFYHFTIILGCNTKVADYRGVNMKKSAVMMTDISLKDQIKALFLCADIFDYPTKEVCDDFYTIIAPKFGCKLMEYDEVEAEYIRIFSMHSVLLKSVPYASWWIDGKMSGA